MQFILCISNTNEKPRFIHNWKHFAVPFFFTLLVLKFRDYFVCFPLCSNKIVKPWKKSTKYPTIKSRLNIVYNLLGNWSCKCLRYTISKF
jgi:hypothetical protein